MEGRRALPVVGDVVGGVVGDGGVAGDVAMVRDSPVVKDMPMVPGDAGDAPHALPPSPPPPDEYYLF